MELFKIGGEFRAHLRNFHDAIELVQIWSRDEDLILDQPGEDAADAPHVDADGYTDKVIGELLTLLSHAVDGSEAVTSFD